MADRSYFPPGWLKGGVNPDEKQKQAIHTDKWDREDLRNMVKSLAAFQASRRKLGDFTPTGTEAMNDMFWALLKADPQLEPTNDIDPGFLVNRRVAEEAQELDEYDRLRRYSVGDDVQAALSALTMEPELETLFDRQAQQQKAAQELQQALQALHQAMQEQRDLDQMIQQWKDDNLPEECPACAAGQDGEGEGEEGEGEGQGQGQGEDEGEGDGPAHTCGLGAQPGGGTGQQQPGRGQGELTEEQKEQLDAFAAAQQAAADAIEQAQKEAEAAGEQFNESMDSGRGDMRQQLKQAMNKAADEAQDMHETALAWGTEPGELHRLPADQRLALAKKLNDPRFKRIADLFGPMRNLMLSEQKRKTVMTPEEVYDVEQGSDIGRMLPQEALLLADEDTEMEWLRRFSEGKLMQYALRGVERLSRGGIIFCTDDQTEIMTASGWKKYTDLEVGEPVLTLNHDTGLSEWQPLLRVNVFPAETRTMVSMEGQWHSSLTTLDHRWPVLGTHRKGTDPGRGKRYRTRDWKTSATLAYDDRIPVAAPCATLPITAKFDDALVELVAWAWTEGTILPPGNAIRIYQSATVNPGHCASIRAALTTLYGPAHIGDQRTLRGGGIPAWREDTSDSGVVSFHLNRTASEPILSHLGTDKAVEPQFITALTAAQLRLFVDRSVDGDGQRRPGVDILGQRVEARNRSFEMACVLLGLPVNTTAYPENRPDRTPGTMQHFTSARKNGRNEVGTDQSWTEEVEHDGIVWCPTTPNGTWLARRRGTVYYTGNCEDGSGSMSGDREMWAKAVMLCLLHLARQQKREFHVLHFGSPGQIRHMAFTEPSHFTMERVIEAASLFFGGGPLRVDQRVVTPDGWREIGSLKCGDVVYGPDGQPTKVTGFYPQGELDLYRVRFSDGAEVICDGSHLWTVQSRQNPGKWKTLRLAEMLERGLRHNNQWRFSVPVTAPVSFPDADLPLDPYLLGYLLGDGSFGYETPRIACAEPEDDQPWRDVLPEGIIVKNYEHRNGFCARYGLATGHGASVANPVTDAIVTLGLKGAGPADKFIPDTYLWASAWQRWGLLQGLLDSDGSYSKPGRAEFSSVSEKLANGVVHLVRSLGGMASLRVCQPSGKALLPLYRVGIRLTQIEAPFRIRRKNMLWQPRTRFARSVVSAERVDRAEAVCIKVDREDGLFLTEGFVVTHNTDFYTPMKKARDLLQEEFRRTGNVRADVVFATDDECWVTDDWMKEYLAFMHKVDATTWGIAIGGSRRDGPLMQMTEGKVALVKSFIDGSDVRDIFRGL